MDKLEQNMRFRTFLRNHADSDELDTHFLRLHDELFSTFDCCKCSNCCKELDIFIGDDEIKAASEFLDIVKDDFINKYIMQADEGYMIKGNPCCFLNADGRCQIQERKPSECIDFPFTNKPERLYSLLSVIEFSEICPVVAEIIERLKKIYNFRDKHSAVL